MAWSGRPVFGQLEHLHAHRCWHERSAWQRRKKLSQFFSIAAAAGAFAALWLPSAFAQDPNEPASFKDVGFRNRYYQAPAYTGSRVLEQNQTGRFAMSALVTWTQSVTVELHTGRIWLVDSVAHQVLMLEPTTRYIPWPAYVYEYAGVRNHPGFLDGSRLQSRFNGPMGIAIASESDSPASIYVADTNNHCVRRILYATGRTTTIVGSKEGKSGLRDGEGVETRFNYPMSLGVNSENTALFVLDNVNRIRYVDISQVPPVVWTLADGACRAATRVPLPDVYSTIIMRTVLCHQDWLERYTNNPTAEVHKNVVICVGHVTTCGPRNFPALSDKQSQYLAFASEELQSAGELRPPGDENGADFWIPAGRDSVASESGSGSRRLTGTTPNAKENTAVRRLFGRKF